MRVRGGVVGLAAVSLLTLGAPPAAAEWNYPGGIAVAPDGRHVYATGQDGTLALARDPATGALSLVSRYPPGESGPLEIAPDGRSVYVGGFRRPDRDSALLAFSRDPASGALRPVSVSGVTFAGGSQVADVAVAPDGSEVYASGYSGHDIAIFDRDGTDGSLRYRSTAPRPPGVAELEGMAVSGDGRWLYAAGRSTPPDSPGALIVRYERLPGGGLAVAQVADCGACVGDTIVPSPAGWLYIGAPGPAAMRWDPDTGVLGAYGGEFAIGGGGLDGGFLRHADLVDDIVLDQRPPVLISARLRRARPAQMRAAAAPRRWRLHLRARDNRSGVRSVQVTRRRARPGKRRQFRRTLLMRRVRRPAWVRVIDGAGNPSRWQRARRGD